MLPDTGQEKDTTVQIESITPVVTKVELAKIFGSWPIFGASAPLGEPPATPAAPATPVVDAPPAGGLPADDPIAKLVADPAAITQLLAQVTELQNAVTAANSKVEAYTQKEADAERAKQTLEQQQASDIDNLKKEIEKRDNILRAKTIENAIGAQKEYQWNSTRQMMAELDLNSLEVNIDVDKGIAEVKGLDTQMKGIAEKNPWLLKAAEQEAAPAGPAPQRQRTSGSAPRPPQAPGDKDAKRREAMKRMPVLAQGRVNS